MTREEQIRDIETTGARAKGRKQLLAHLRGERITQAGAIAAKCYDCQGYCEDSARVECGLDLCPLFPYSPFNPNKTKIRQKATNNPGTFGDPDGETEAA